MRAESHKIICTNNVQTNGGPNVIVTDILGGGSGFSGIFFSIRNRGDITILTDVPGELRKFPEDYYRIPNHFLFPLDERHTTQSLLATHYSIDHPVHRLIGIALSVEGMGQRGGLGAIGGSLRLQSRLFSEMVNRLLDKVLILSGGNLQHLWIRSFGSGSGGTYSLFEILLIAALVERLKALGVTIKVSFFMVDSMAFLGLGPNIHKNQACAIMAIHDLMHENKIAKNDKVFYELRLIGTPPTGTDSQLRQEFKLLDQQAWLCPEMLEYLQIAGPNYALMGPYGNIVHTSTDFFRSIPRQLVASTVSTEFYFAIQEGIDEIRPMSDLIERIEPNHVVVETPRSSIPSIVDSCDRLTSSEMLQATSRPGDIHSYEFSVINAKGEEYKCDQISEHFTNPPKTLYAAIQNATVVATIKAVIEEELSIVLDEVSELKKRIARQQKKTTVAYSKAQTARRFVEMAKKRAIREGNELRRLADQLTVRLAMKSEIEKSIRSLVQELASQTSRLDSIAQILEQHRQKGRSDDSRGLFFFNDVNTAFPDLMTLAPLDSDRQQLVLAAQAFAVTANGIQYILDAATNTVEDLANTAIGEAATQGAWPGAIPQHAARKVYVFPPVASSLSVSLRNGVVALDPNARVFVSDTAEFGMNIVRFHVFSPESDSELLPGLLADAYRQALAEPLDVLHRLPPQHDQATKSESK